MHVIVVGAGPAGLTASYLLSKKGIPVTVLEANSEYVGGLAKTVRCKDFYFDIGGHRFFSKSKAVEDLWTELLPQDMIICKRKSRIYYSGKFFSYPIRPFEALFKLGWWESFRCLGSYFVSKLMPVRTPKSFEDWVSNQFGKRLFDIFFRTYTEKVWGMDCKEISADWAAQRIRKLSLGSAILNAFRKQPSRDEVIKTLIDSFRYPRLGPGMMWQAAARRTQEQGGKIFMGCRVKELHFHDRSPRWEVIYENHNKEQNSIWGDEVISSAPLRELIPAIYPLPSCAGAAKKLRYRDFLTVALILKERHSFDDNWIYIHDPSVKVGRIQNFKAYSPQMVPSLSLCCYGLEYFCFEGDGLWTSSDEELIRLAKAELEKLKLADSGDVLDGCVVRQPKAYPVYDEHYVDHVERIRKEIEDHYPGLHLVGRNGMHKYNNQDHAMMTAMLTVENILAHEKKFDIWCVNQDAEYQETSERMVETGLRITPEPLKKEKFHP